MIATACGGDDGGSGGGGAETAATIDSGVQAGIDKAFSDTTVAGETSPKVEHPKTMEEWEALWAEQRAAVVKRITDEGWGKSADGATLTGPEGFTIDLSKCPAGWSDTEGLTDSTIKIGQAIAQSGTFAEYNNYGNGMKTVFDWYGEQGAFTDSEGKDRKIEYLAKDDGYDPARTIPLVDEFLDSEKSFAIWTLGSPSSLKTYDKINQRCVPHPMAITGHAAWGDPVNHPWTTGAPSLSYSSEAVLWGKFLEQHIDEFPTDRKIVVAALVMNNDFGRLYKGSFEAYLAQSEVLKDRIDFQTDTIEAQAPTVTDPMTTLASVSPDVFIAMMAATPCTQTVVEAAQNGMKESVKYLFMPATCAGTTFVKAEKVGGDGSAADGWWIVNPGAKDITDPAFAEDPFVKWGTEQIAAEGFDPKSSSLFSLGLGMGWVFSQAAMIAGELPGGLTRSNFVLAERAIDMTYPMAVEGVTFAMNGNKDAFFIEAGAFQVWHSAEQTWKNESPLVDLNGQSKNCAFDQAAGVCR